MAKEPQENTDSPVRKTMCKTCPFRPGSPTAYLKDDLELSARTETSRVCHNTGRNNAFHEETGFPEHICRGARDVQLEQFDRIGFLSAPTDEAWNVARLKYGFPPQIVQNPRRKATKL